MTTGDNLLQAILENPADDDLRLIYADYLMEQGEQGRGEFIRVQIERERAAEAKSALSVMECRSLRRGGLCRGLCKACKNNEQRQELRQREDELRGREQWLMEVHGQDFVLPLARALGVSEAPGLHEGNRFRYIGTRYLSFGDPGNGIALDWSRGFVSRVECTCEWFAADDYALARALFSRHPCEGVRLVDREPHRTFWNNAERYYWLIAGDAPAIFASPNFERFQQQQDIVPEEIGARLMPEAKRDAEGWNSWLRIYDTREAAHADLSQACCLLGRERAGVTAFAPGNA